ncbi:MAG: threonine aldolase [Clostridia bacterium]|nr:threonine aldolase [Clostridia bacterium]
MISFRSDYSLGAHPKVLEALIKTNYEHTDGYGIDSHCRNAERLVKEMIGNADCGVHMMIGGTPCNITVISSALKPYETVISVRTGHIYAHETGGIEATGHRITAVEGINGKLTPALIDKAFEEYDDEHTAKPGMAYISLPTETGTVYTKAELNALCEKCKEKNIYLYVDGARLGSALTCGACDISLRDLAKLCDAFYIGGTKNGALYGEALVILDKDINDHFRWMIKRQGVMLAKGRTIGVQFEALLEGGDDCVYFQAARHANKMADILRKGLSSMNISFLGDSPTNQVFPILPLSVVEKLENDFFFYRWGLEKDGKTAVRFVTSWGTTETEIEELLCQTGKLMGKSLC